jgi:hypothetical protein
VVLPPDLIKNLSSGDIENNPQYLVDLEELSIKSAKIKA